MLQASKRLIHHWPGVSLTKCIHTGVRYKKKLTMNCNACAHDIINLHTAVANLESSWEGLQKTNIFTNQLRWMLPNRTSTSNNITSGIPRAHHPPPFIKTIPSVSSIHREGGEEGSGHNKNNSSSLVHDLQ